MAKRSANKPAKRKLQSTIKEVFGLVRNQYDVPPPPEQKLPLIEEMILAVLAEDAQEARARAALVRLRERFCDWNEVRVSPIPELAEVLADLPNPTDKARRLKNLLYDVFETEYTFEIDKWTKGGIKGLSSKFKGKGWFTEYVRERLARDVFCNNACPVDGTAVRVWSRILGVAPEVSVVQPLLRKALPQKDFADVDAVVREHGSVLCTERVPRCDACFLAVSCSYVAQNAEGLAVTEGAGRSRARSNRSKGKTAERARGGKAGSKPRSSAKAAARSSDKSRTKKRSK